MVGPIGPEDADAGTDNANVLSRQVNFGLTSPAAGQLHIPAFARDLRCGLVS
jgi:hypothetical protein